MEPALTRLAEFVASVPATDHTPDGIATAKRAFLDTISCMLLGADEEVTRVAIAAATAWGEGPAPVYGTDSRLPAPWAAMANGASAHSLDLDDFTLQANDHASAVLIPAVLGAAVGRPVSGKDVIDAYLVGLEVIFRLGEAVNIDHYKLGWHTTSTLDSIGATAAVARLTRLPPSQVAAAMSLTTSLGSGYVSQFGTMAKPLHAGFSAKNGILAAGLAGAGASAYAGALDGEISFASLLVPPGKARFDEPLAKLGAPWGVDELGLGAKHYPSCGYTHRAIDGSIELHEHLGIQSAGEVEFVSISLPDFHLAILPFGVPKDPTEALFSTAYCAATALATGRCTMDDFTAHAVGRADILDLSGRIDVAARVPKNPDVNIDPGDPDIVAVRLRDGRTAEVKMPLFTGAPGKAMTPDQFTKKFRDCCRKHDSNEDRASARAEAIENAIADLEAASTLSGLEAALSYG